MPYKSLSTRNFPAPAIRRPEEYFRVYTYSGWRHLLGDETRYTPNLRVDDTTRRVDSSLINSSHIHKRVISNGLRFQSSEGNYLQRTPASSSADPRTWTLSFWVKRSIFATQQTILAAGNSNGVTPFECNLFINTSNQLSFIWNGNGGGIGDTWLCQRSFGTQSWHHVVLKADLSNATRANRMTLWIDGELHTFTPTGNASNSATTAWGNSAHVHRWGVQTWTLANYADLAIADVHFLDGTGLTASDFGEYNADGIWVPKTVSITSSQYGTNGYHLDFANAVSASQLGTDKAPIGTGHGAQCNWTPTLTSCWREYGNNIIPGGFRYYGNNAVTHVGWCWKAGTAPGFEIVRYTGNGVTTGRAIPHSLGRKPAMIAIKSIISGNGWVIYHQSRDFGASGSSSYTQWNTTAAELNVTSSDAETVFGNGTTFVSPTTTHFTVGGWPNGNGIDHIAYLWTEVPGFSKFGAYTGNNSTDGKFVHCGFRPAFVMLKRVGGVESWIIQDIARDGGVNATNNWLYPNLTNADGSGTNLIDLLSNGFKIRNNVSGGHVVDAYIYAAFAEHPQKYARAR